MNKYRACYVGWEIGKLICELIYGEFDFRYVDEDWVDFEASSLEKACLMVNDEWILEIEEAWRYKDLFVYNIEGHEGWLVWDQRLEGVK